MRFAADYWSRIAAGAGASGDRPHDLRYVFDENGDRQTGEAVAMAETVGSPPVHAWVIGNEVRGVYDGTFFSSYPHYGAMWHRFPEGHCLRQRAERYVKEGS